MMRRMLARIAAVGLLFAAAAALGAGPDGFVPRRLDQPAAAARAGAALTRPRVLAAQSLSGSAPFSVAVMTTVGGPGTVQDSLRLLADVDGREDLVADHQSTPVDRAMAANPATEFFTRAVPSAHTIANGFSDNQFWYGDSVGRINVDFDSDGDGDVDVSNTIDIPTLVASGVSGAFALANAIGGDATSGSVVVTGLAVNPVADLGEYTAGLCGIIGEVLYVAVHDPAGGSLDGAGRPIRTRIFALPTYESGGAVFAGPAVQLVRHHLGNLGGLAVDDDGSLYFQLADLQGFSGAAVFKATEQPHAVCGDTSRKNRALAPFLTDGALELDGATPVEAAGGAVAITNFSGTATTFGNVAAMTAGPCSTLYLAMSHSHEAGAPGEGPFTNPAALGVTPSMIVSLADAAGAVDGCTSPGGLQPGILPIGDGFADPARADLAPIPGVNNFRVFALGGGPDRRAAGDPVFGGPADTLQLDFQVDPTPFAGIAVDEERAVYVVSGGTPAGADGDPSPARGEILKFPDRAPADRRADFVDLRGDTLPDPPDNGGNAGDGDSDRFDHVFWTAPMDSGAPTGIAGLARGFLRYLNRTATVAIPNLPSGAPQGDDDANGPIAFDAFDPSGQVAGGDDAASPFTGDDTAGGFEFAFGGFAAGMCTTPWTEFYLGSNGFVTFGSGDTDNTPSIPDLLSAMPRIAPAWTDLNPAGRGTSTRSFPVQALGFAGPNAFKVRWIDVPPFGDEMCGAVATVAVTLYDDGTGDDESMAGVPEGPTDLRFRGGAGAPPRGDGRGPVDFEYCRMDLLGTANQPVLVGYSEGGQDPAFPNVCETDVSQAARAADAGSGLIGDGTQRVLFELFRDGVRPAPQVAGAIDFDLRFAGNDPASTSGPTQPDPSRDFASLFGADCATGADLTCSCVLVIDPQSLPGGDQYDAQLLAQGGTEPFSYAVTGGALPAGVALDADGHLAGASASSGGVSFEVTATDARSCTAHQTYAFQATCASAATYASIGCRLGVLAAGTNGLPAGKLARKLARLLAGAQQQLAKAEQSAAAGKTRPAKRRLGKTAKAVRKFGKLLASRKAERQLDEATRAGLRLAAEPVVADVAVLRGTL
jgi:hypothetical protein